jgi:hypothetical protein
LDSSENKRMSEVQMFALMIKHHPQFF